jgi:septal ring factor EnvC (AmiA/AmiB activator)
VAGGVGVIEQGKPYTVRYEAVNAMLLNEFLKEHRKVEEQNVKQQKLEATVAQQRKEIDALKAELKEQAALIQKVSAQLAAASPSRGGLEVTKPAPQMVLNNQ